MNILGICGAIGWDGNEQVATDEKDQKKDYWVHGSGATLIMDGELKNSMCEERFSRIKYDGNYPVLAIEKILDHNKLTKYDIDLVVYVGNANLISFKLKEIGYIPEQCEFAEAETQDRIALVGYSLSYYR